MLPFEIPAIIKDVQKIINIQLGIHTHNDSGNAVANSLMAISEGVSHVQGTINGIGERCGNADLIPIIANIELKLGKKCIGDNQLTNLREISRFVNEITNLKSQKNQPFVGESAFAHKGGIHADAVRKNPKTYEHVNPTQVGNKQRIIVSELSGRSNLIYKAIEYGIDFEQNNPIIRDLLKKLKKLESLGFQFEAAEASFELLMKKSLNQCSTFFELIDYTNITSKRNGDVNPPAQVILRLKINEEEKHAGGIGDGPVNALDKAMREILVPLHPILLDMCLVDYSLRILNDKRGSAAKTRVLIEWSDGISKWGTVGISDNQIEAGWQALSDGFAYKLMKEAEKEAELKKQRNIKKFLIILKNFLVNKVLIQYFIKFYLQNVHKIKFIKRKDK